ncbi:putative mediator of RNA polymerase II transcription subunit 13 [Apostichopus japonicus]|uniref:Mediator of RNA polymerase II transcription subunit 13 n=1 Tax=Stichopus japonicus TaxID=307972 RepID=A0A2G8JEW1_STIJA|nr:putative mediator of RNA polymerase II transcription subunit 13 [Apostichopus japonicus]
MPHSQEDLQDGNLENLYEHDNSGERFSQPHKRLRQERRTRSCLDSNVFSLQNDVDTLQRVKTPDFDPYEFMDTSPTEGGSSSTRSKGKDGKGKQRGLQQRRNSIKKGKKQEEEAQRKAEGEKARQEAMTPMNVSYPNEPFKMGDFGVPLLPRPESSSLTTEKDLQITLNDFESLFESSDEDDDRVPLTNVSSDFPCGANSEENLSTRTLFGSSISSSSMSGPLTGGDLGRMYPTPPSEEQTHFSPVNHPCPELSSNLTSYGSNQTRDMTVDWTYVYKVPAVEKIVGATMYAPLKSLPSSRCPPLKVPEYCIYKPSWQLPLSPKPELIPLIKESTIPMVPSVERPTSIQPTVWTNPIGRDHGISRHVPRQSGAQECRQPGPAPAASEASSFRNLNSIEQPSSAAICPNFVKDGVEELHRTSKIVLKLIQDQCHSPYSSLQSLLSVIRERTEYQYGQIARSNLEYLDACDACVSAIDDGRHLSESAGRGAWDPQYLRHRCLHTWAYNPGYVRIPLSSQDIVQVLRSLQPLLHDAIQKKRTKRLWERPYAVQGPLTWQVFFNIAIQDASESPEPLPVPPLLVGYEKDWMSSSPYAVLYWEKLLLEPFSSSRDIAYIALVPDQEFICKRAKTFFKELTSVYESCNLGRHVPMAKSMRNGILRIGQKYASKVESEQVDSWFSDINELPEAAKIKVFAQVCKAYVAPYLMKDPQMHRCLPANQPKWIGPMLHTARYLSAHQP